MDPLAAHQRTQDAFWGVFAHVQPPQLDAATPCTEWTVRDLIEQVIGGNERVAIRAGLHTEPPARPGGLLKAHRATAAAAPAVFAALNGMTAIFELPIGRAPGSTFILNEQDCKRTDQAGRRAP
jgi:mycothiol maleylpyruvate isomerase-like protein